MILLVWVYHGDADSSNRSLQTLLIGSFLKDDYELGVCAPRLPLS